MNRSDYEQQWDFEPEQRIPADAPTPWFVAGYSFKAVDNVMRVDYLAHRMKQAPTTYAVPGGEVTYIGHAEELRGLPHGRGTLFVLWPVGIQASGGLDRVIAEAAVRVQETRTLAAGQRQS